MNIPNPIMNSPIVGYAHHRILLDDSGVPVDYEFLEVNETFGTITGLAGTPLAGRNVREVIPGIEHAEFDWIGHYARIALEGGEEEFEHYSEPLGRWYRIHVYSSERMTFTTLFTDITDLRHTEQRLKDSEERLHLALAGTGAGLWDWDLVDNTVYFSPLWKSMLGYEEHEVQNAFEGWKALWHPDDAARIEIAVQDYLASKVDFYEVEHRLRHKDGNWRWILTRGDIIRDQDGTPVRWVGTNIDVTLRKAAERQIAQTNELLVNLSAQLPGVIYQYRYHPDGRNYFPYASENIRFIYEVTPDEVKEDASRALSRLHPDDHDSVIARIGKSFETLELWEDDYRVVLPERGERWLRGVARPQPLDDGSVLWHGYISDVTERKEGAIERARTKELLELAISGTNDGIWDWNIITNDLFLSPRWKEMIGYQDHEVENRLDSFFRFLHPDDVERVKGHVTDYLDGKTSVYEVEFRYRHKNGTCIWVRARGKTLRDQDGTPYRMAGSHTDITEQKRFEAELRRAKEEAEAASTAKSQFLAHMSHEIRTPLNGVIGFTELLKNTGLTPVQQQYVNSANISGHALMGIINDILDFSKIEAGMMKLENVRTDMYRLVEESVEIIKYSVGKKRLEVLLDVEPAMPRFAVVDPVRLKQILANLLSNAIKFTEEGEVGLKVRYEPRGGGTGRFSFSVRDTGIGITEAQKDKLFRAFSQADSATTRKYGGTGLGLIISDLIAREMGSSIQLESAQGLGSRFFFDLVTETEEGDPVDTLPLSQVRRCLVIDDNASNRTILEHTLEAWGIQSVSCDNGLSALRQLETAEPFDAMICDYHMPCLDGLGTVRMVREKLGLTAQQLPVILLHSSCDDAQLHRGCEELGIRFLLTKPAKNDDLLACLGRIREPASNDAGCEGSTADVPVAARSAVGDGPSPDPLRLDATGTILVAEDVAMNMTLITAMLDKIFPGASVVEAADGREAVERWETHQPDVILMDVQMPKMDGLEATREIRARERDRPVRDRAGRVTILALTAGALKEEEAKCVDAGMDGFLTKPVDPKRISEAVGPHLRPTGECIRCEIPGITRRTDRVDRPGP